VDLTTRNFLPAVYERLEREGLAGGSAPAVWQQALVRDHPTMIRFTQASGLTLLVWPANTAREQVAACFDKDGMLRCAAVLSRWPTIKSMAGIESWLREFAPQRLADIGVPADPASSQLIVGPRMHWEPCEQSPAPWWPFYEITVVPRIGSRRTVHLDVAGRFHAGLTTPDRRGG
jgi:hypothetical protein